MHKHGPCSVRNLFECSREAEASAGEWKAGLPVAIKMVEFRSNTVDSQVQQVAREAAIAGVLVHRNIVATYTNTVGPVEAEQSSDTTAGPHHNLYKFCLVQVRRNAMHAPMHAADAAQHHASPRRRLQSGLCCRRGACMRHAWHAWCGASGSFKRPCEWPVPCMHSMRQTQC
jgi:hypothetical protein